jgi:MFS family permease
MSRSKITVLLLCLINAFSYIDRSALALVLPQIKTEFHLSDTVLGLVSGLPFALCYSFCMLPAAWLADNFNRRTLLSVSLAFWSLCTAATSTVQNGLQLAASRFLLGAGESPGLPASTSLIADMVPLQRRPIAFSLLAASVYVGPLVGFPLLGMVISDRGWRAAFLAAGIPGLLVALVFYLVAREPVRVQRVANGATAGWREMRARFRDLLQIRSYLFVVIAGALSAISFGSTLSWGPTFLTRVHGLDPVSVAWYFGTVRGIAGLCGALLAGVAITVLARRNARWMIRAPIFLVAALFFSDALFLLPPDRAWWQCGLALSAFLSAAIVAASYTLYVSVAATQARATATAVYLFCAGLTGQSLGPMIVGALTDAFSARWGVQAIAYAMLIAATTALLSAGMLVMAARTWVNDALRTRERDMVLAPDHHQGHK